MMTSEQAQFRKFVRRALNFLLFFLGFMTGGIVLLYWYQVLGPIGISSVSLLLPSGQTQYFHHILVGYALFIIGTPMVFAHEFTEAIGFFLIGMGTIIFIDDTIQHYTNGTFVCAALASC